MPSLPSIDIDPLIAAAAVIVATACTDAVYVMFTNAVVKRRRLPAASWSSIWYMLSSFAVISYTHHWVCVLFAAAGLVHRRLCHHDLPASRPGLSTSAGRLRRGLRAKGWSQNRSSSPLRGEGFPPRSCASDALRKSHGGKGEGEPCSTTQKPPHPPAKRERFARARIALLLPAEPGRGTGHATRLRSTGFLGRRTSSPRGGTVPVTHPSWERDERSISEAREPGIARGLIQRRCSLLLLSPWGEGLPPRSCARCSRAALAQVAWREGRGGDKSIDRLQSPLTRRVLRTRHAPQGERRSSVIAEPPPLPNGERRKSA